MFGMFSFRSRKVRVDGLVEIIRKLSSFLWACINRLEELFIVEEIQDSDHIIR